MGFFEGMFALVALTSCFFIWLLPILLIAISDRTDGKEKFAWLLAVIFISWFAWVFYLLLAPLREKSNGRGYDYDQRYRRYR